jgi:multiple sugar transport system permease protein
MTLRRAGPFAGWLFLLGVAATAVYPVVVLLFTALRPQHAAPTGLGPPSSLDWSNFATAWHRARLGRLFPHSLGITAAAVALLLAVACPAGYALGCLRFAGRRALLLALTALMIMPPAVLLAPTVHVLLSLGLLNTYAGLVLVLAALHAPFAIFLCSAQFSTLPAELLEASRAEGASELRTFAQVALPLVRPTVLALAALNVLACWNELLYSVVVLQGEEHRTVMAGLALLSGQFEIPAPVIAAAVALSSIPVVLVFALFQRSLVRGLTQGAEK